MAKIIQEIQVEVARKNLFQAIVSKQYDYNSRFLKATLCDNGVPIMINPSSTVTINANRPDGTCKRFAGVSNDDNTVTVPISEWMLELAGMVYCDISVTRPGESMLTSTSFSIDVEPAAAVLEEPKPPALTIYIGSYKRDLTADISLHINGEEVYRSNGLHDVETFQYDTMPAAASITLHSGSVGYARVGSSWEDYTELFSDDVTNFDLLTLGYAEIYISNSY